MPIFRKPIFYTECDECGTRFHVGSGGVCVNCKRILCDRHLHGSLVRRLQMAFGATPLCVACRTGVEPRRVDVSAPGARPGGRMSGGAGAPR